MRKWTCMSAFMQWQYGICSLPNGWCDQVPLYSRCMILASNDWCRCLDGGYLGWVRLAHRPPSSLEFLDVWSWPPMIGVGVWMGVIWVGWGWFTGLCLLWNFEKICSLRYVFNLLQLYYAHHLKSYSLMNLWDMSAFTQWQYGICSRPNGWCHQAGGDIYSAIFWPSPYPPQQTLHLDIFFLRPPFSSLK